MTGIYLEQFPSGPLNAPQDVIGQIRQAPSLNFPTTGDFEDFDIDAGGNIGSLPPLMHVVFRLDSSGPQTLFVVGDGFQDFAASPGGYLTELLISQVQVHQLARRIDTGDLFFDQVQTGVLHVDQQLIDTYQIQDFWQTPEYFELDLQLPGARVENSPSTNSPAFEYFDEYYLSFTGNPIASTNGVFPENSRFLITTSDEDLIGQRESNWDPRWFERVGYGLFTQFEDIIDFNLLSDVEKQSIRDANDPSQMVHDALGGDDQVTLPNSGHNQLTDDFSYDPLNVFFAGDGNDTILGGDQDDKIDGGASNDILKGGEGNDELDGGDDDDTLDGGADDDELDAGDGTDTGFGGEGSDRFKAAAGNNTYYGYGGIEEDLEALRYADPFDDMFDGAFGTEHATAGSTSRYYGGEAEDRTSDMDKVKLSGLPTDYSIVDPITAGQATVVSSSQEDGGTLNLFDIEVAEFSGLPEFAVVKEQHRFIDNAKLAVLAYRDHKAGAHTNDWWPLHSIQLGLDTFWSSDGTDYSFVNGVYTAENAILAANAHVYFGQVDGKNTLAISFRGTDSVGDVADWPDFQTHYDRFEPLISAVNQYISDNAVEHVLVTGHSLGGSMAQMYMAEHASDNRFQAVTFGSPGAEGDLWDPRITNFAHAHDAVPLAAGAFRELVAIKNVLAWIPNGLQPPIVTGIEKLIQFVETTTELEDYRQSGISLRVVRPDTDWLNVLDEHGKELYETTTRELLPFYEIIEAEVAALNATAGSNDFINIVAGTAGNDDLQFDPATLEFAGFADELFLGGDGDDTITPGRGIDTIFGGKSGDTVQLDGIIGTNLIAKVQGNRIEVTKTNSLGTDESYKKTLYDIEFLSDDVMVYVTQLLGADSLIESASQTLETTESVVRLVGDDSVIVGGTSGDDILLGSSGNDTLTGNDGDDQVFGLAGNDILVGGAGNGDDTYDGGEGIDTLVYSSATGPVTVDLETGVASGDDIDDDIIIDIENVIGGSGNDQISGNGLANELIGSAGDDTLRGRAGDDFLSGNSGDDTHFGGEGADTFAFTLNHGRDRIEDFELGVDRLYYLGDAVSLDDIETQQSGNDLIVRFDASDSESEVMLVGVSRSAFLQNSTAVDLESLTLDLDNDFYNTAQDVPLQVDASAGLLSNDAVSAENVASISVLLGPENGDLLLNENGGFTYTPDAGYSGNDLFLYEVVAESGASATASAFVAVGNSTITDIAVISGGQIQENASAGTSVAVFASTGSPGAGLALLDDSGGQFVLDGNDLKIAPGAVVDFEQGATRTVRMIASDGGTAFQKDVLLQITNMAISDIEMVSGGTVRESAAANTVVATFEASENPAEPTADFSIVSGGDGQFYLDGNELKVSPGTTFDFDDQSNYFITFSATDGTGPAYEESFDIFVENVGPILGTPDEDVLDGTGFDDEIQALESDDIINASNGDDDIDGGPGTDTVVYSRGRNQVTHDWMNDGTIVVTRTALGEGTDTLTNVERIDLDDGSLLYDVDTPNLGFGYRIYQASFDRTPDEGGVLFWIGVLDDLDNQGWSQYDKEQFLATQFIQSDEFKALFGANPTNEEYIDAMYQNVLDRLPDQGGYDFWVGGMVNDGLTREDILIAFTKSDENVDRTAPDLDDGVWVV